MGFFTDLFIKGLRTRKLAAALDTSKLVKVHGVLFTLRKVSPLDYARGAKALQMHFDTFKSKGQREQLETLVNGEDKVKEHYRHVFMSSVVEPKLRWNDKKDTDDTSESIWVDNLFTDWDLAYNLYLEIMYVSYGKKKLMSLISQKKD